MEYKFKYPLTPPGVAESDPRLVADRDEQDGDAILKKKTHETCFPHI